MTKKTIKKLRNSINRHNRRVRAENTIFENMTKAEQRVRLARDVIELVAAKKLVARSGVWLSLGDRMGTLVKGDVADEEQMNKLLPGIEQCNACAVGALLYCTVMRANALTAGEIRSEDTDDLSIRDFTKIKEYLGKWFSTSQLEQMEAAFEKRHEPEDQTKVVLAAGRMFARRAHDADGRYWEDDESVDDETRLVVIMKNVVENGGTFKSKRYVNKEAKDVL